MFSGLTVENAGQEEIETRREIDEHIRNFAEGTISNRFGKLYLKNYSLKSVTKNRMLLIFTPTRIHWNDKKQLSTFESFFIWR